jgi:hypothetical protein
MSTTEPPEKVQGLAYPAEQSKGDLMNESELAEKLRADHRTGAGALVDLQLRRVLEDVRSRVFEALSDGTGHVELRTRIDSAATEIVPVPTDGTEPLG